MLELHEESIVMPKICHPELGKTIHASISDNQSFIIQLSIICYDPQSIYFIIQTLKGFIFSMEIAAQGDSEKLPYS